MPVTCAAHSKRVLKRVERHCSVMSLIICTNVNEMLRDRESEELGGIVSCTSTVSGSRAAGTAEVYGDGGLLELWHTCL